MMNPTVAIVGRPNVGKSTLFNRLSRSRDALVDDIPGITRDRLYASINHDGVAFTLVDTGGFEDIGQDPLLEKVRHQVSTAVNESDAIIFMVDGRQGVMPGDEEIIDLLRRSRKTIFLAVNKIDGPEHDSLTLEFFRFGIDKVYPISASHGYGVRALFDDIVKELPRTDSIWEDSGRIRVAVLGKPNVGKSSLINRILGLDRLLVSDIPGTTRDSVDMPFSYQGKDYLLIDTAGIRRKARVKDKIDKFSMIKAIGTLRRCHVAVILIGADEGVSDQDARIFGYAEERGRAIVTVVNKWDLIKGEPRKRDDLERGIDRRLQFVSYAPRVNLSALTGERVVKLFSKIDLVFEQFSRRIPTPSVNKALGTMIEKHPPPRIGRGRLKFFYATQPRTKPPTFVVFVNRPDMVHFSYERFIINQLREQFRLEASPIKLIFKKRGEKNNP
ncbi:ribosome biogenesis GTPase Der [Thermodesulfobacteriota bacterium]